ncbi:unnamed protein product [Soboliphyme baturini]|uniref:Uncharacterized protein n=1 Tax=Soboliphyme baturini TaxID=241478 RepID=A0A3P8BBV8_9BILA|nr:unnamed protein product [Soboliphyme baturini]
MCSVLTRLSCSIKGLVFANENAKRLFDDLLNNYNKLRRPVRNPHDVLTILLKLRLSQIIDVHEKDQIMTTSVWLRQEWTDDQLMWDPNQYSGVSVLYVPAEMIWLPDIVLYNNADSNFNITITTKATLHHNGLVIWEPPAIYKSMCSINVEWFPFDEQTCHLKFGSWSYTSKELDLQHLDGNVEYVMEKDERDNTWSNISVLWNGIAKRHGKAYPACCPATQTFIDITYYINLRRKPLFYTVNLVFPCVGISFLTILVFYLPSHSGEKISLCISILVSLTVFFLLLAELIPATSTALPLIGKYLLFTMVMVTLSIIVTVVVLNLHFRTPTTHRMPKWLKIIFLQKLPRYLFMRRPLGSEDSLRCLDTHRNFRKKSVFQKTFIDDDGIIQSAQEPGQMPTRPQYLQVPEADSALCETLDKMIMIPPIQRACENLCFIAKLLQKKDRDDKIDEDWKFVAAVLDRLFLWIFAVVCFLGTLIILLQAPSFYDDRVPYEPRLPVL